MFLVSLLLISDPFCCCTTAEKLGLPFVPPYLEQSMRMGGGGVGLSNIGGMIQGVNYASAAAGILSSSGSELVCSPTAPANSASIS